MACAACLTIPPVVVKDYVEKGTWEEVGGYKTCQSFLLELHSLCSISISSFESRNPFNLPHFSPTNSNITDVTGPATATKAIIDVYDIFGPSSQVLQGADGLAKALGALVLVPDLLEGRYGKAKFFYGDKLTEEEEKEKGTFFGFAFDFARHGKTFSAVTEAAKAKFTGVESWGTYGLCWGGKVS